jgi:hypothetical protein
MTNRNENGAANRTMNVFTLDMTLIKSQETGTARNNIPTCNLFANKGLFHTE